MGAFYGPTPINLFVHNSELGALNIVNTLILGLIFGNLLNLVNTYQTLL
jgi:hypothetical protein